MIMLGIVLVGMYRVMMVDKLRQMSMALLRKYYVIRQLDISSRQYENDS